MELHRKSSTEKVAAAGAGADAAVPHPASILKQPAAARSVVVSENPQPSTGKPDGSYSNSNPSQPQQPQQKKKHGGDFWVWPSADDSSDEDECLENSASPIEERIYFKYFSFRMHLRPGALKEELARKSTLDDMESKAEIAKDYLLGLGCSKKAVEEVFCNDWDFLDWLFTHHFGASSNGFQPSSLPSHRDPLSEAKTIARGHLDALLHRKEFDNMPKMHNKTEQIIRDMLQQQHNQQQQCVQSTTTFATCNFNDNGSSGPVFKQPHPGKLSAAPSQQAFGGAASTSASVVNARNCDSGNAATFSVGYDAGPQRGLISFSRSSASSYDAVSQHPFFTADSQHSDDLDTSDDLE